MIYATPGFILDVPIARAGHVPRAIPWRLADPTAVWLDSVEEAAATASRPLGLIVNFPRNPSGALATPNDWERIGYLVERYNILLVVDDVYGFLDPTLRRRVVDPDRVVIVDSLSKRMAAPGLRLGYVHGSPANVAAIRASAARTSVGVSPLVTGLGAVAVSRYLSGDLSRTVKAALADRRSRVRDAVGERLGERLVLPDHAFYGCVQLWNTASADAHMAALRDRGVFPSAGRDTAGAYLRFCIGADPRVDEALVEVAEVCRGIDASRWAEVPILH